MGPFIGPGGTIFLNISSQHSNIYLFGTGDQEQPFLLHFVAWIEEMDLDSEWEHSKRHLSGYIAMPVVFSVVSVCSPPGKA